MMDEAAIMETMSGWYKYINVDLGDSRVEHLPFLDAPYILASVVALYCIFVLHTGPEIMKAKKPYDLEKTMVLYNLTQICINFYFAFQVTRYVILSYRHSFFCAEFEYADDPISLKLAYLVYHFFLSRTFDVFDTVFMVFRKKFKQITFLHVYHHSIMAVITWIFAKYAPGGHFLYFIAINSTVHVIMYSYYLLAAFNPEYNRNLWWKKYITLIQLVQFVVLIVQSVANVVNPYCRYPKYLLFSMIPQGVLFFILFLDFYKKKYKKK